MKKIKIGTRGSKLALWQAHHTKDQLAELGVDAELIIIKTKGDKIQHLGFDKIEGKGFFTKEIEDALLRGEVDMAVHSMKDMPTTQPEGLVLAGVSYRENPADWLLIRPEAQTDGPLFSLKKEAIVGTSSARRKAQMLDFRPDVQLQDIRGNVPTRIEKLRRGDFDAILLAGAGIQRLELDLSDLRVIKFNPREFTPAPAQGVLTYQCCEADLETRRLIRQLHHPEVSAATNVERKILKLIEGGCHVPLGAYCEQDANQHYHVWAAYAKSWDAPVIRVRLSSSTSFNLSERVFAKLQEG
ncbi:MAG: hydroxymethylbilane synthase [Bacteroidota bacterium]